jgi:signal transduction histidine kinase
MSESEFRVEGGEMLVVDDDPRNCRLLEGYLHSEGYRVRRAEDGPTALRMAQEIPPDVVLLDVMMPGMSGYEVCRELKSSAATRHTQIMLVTALAGTNHQVEGLDTGADDWVSKPVRREEFLARVRSLLRARRLLMEVDRARSALAARNKELELKKTLAQTLVHDLKSPLAAVVANLDLLDRTADSREHELTGRCKASASRMLRMILDLLDVDSLEEGRLLPRREAVDAGALVASAVVDAELVARHRNVRLETRLPDGKCFASGDPDLLRRMVDNLLANAMEHSPAGTTVTVTAGTREEGVEIQVADQGPGVPASQRENVFEKYARLELRQAGVTANRGLGLTFCRLAAEAHGGAIWIEEAPGGGALFRVLVPAHEAEAAVPDGAMVLSA